MRTLEEQRYDLQLEVQELWSEIFSDQIFTLSASNMLRYDISKKNVKRLKGVLESIKSELIAKKPLHEYK